MRRLEIFRIGEGKAVPELLEPPNWGNPPAQIVDKRLQRCKILRSRIQDGTLPNLVFSDEKKFDVKYHFNTQNNWVWSRNEDERSTVVARKQCPASVMVWAAVRVPKKSPLFCWSKGEIEPTELSRWHPYWCIVALRFKKCPWSFQRDSAQSNATKKSQEWLSENVPHFITKEEWAPSSHNLNPLDFGIWSYLESKVSTVHHQSLKALNVKVRKKCAKISQKVIRDSCKAFSKRLQLVNW